MHILIVDRDRDAAQALSEILEGMGHEVEVNPSKNKAMERLKNEPFDVAMIDPAPLPSAKPMAMQLRWQERENYLYLFVLTSDPENTEVMRSGLNGSITKPYKVERAAAKIKNAERLVGFFKKLNDNEDIRTQGAVFGKRPFQQLLLSALDRTYRYSEQGFLLFLEMSNFDEAQEELGPEVSENLTNEFSDYVARLRRMSDFLARTDKNEFVLLMQRPEDESEPIDAAERFVVALKEYKSDYFRPSFRIRLVQLPMAKSLMETNIDKEGNENRVIAEKQ